MKGLGVGGDGGDDDSNGGSGGCPLVDVIGSDSGGGGGDQDSNESPAANKTDIESRPTKRYAEFETPSEIRKECPERIIHFAFSFRVLSCSFLV